MILTKCFEEVCRGKLSVKENGAIVDVESPAHADEQDLQAAYRVAIGRDKDMEMETDRGRNQREDEAGRGQNAQCSRQWKIMVRMVNPQVNMQNHINNFFFFSFEVQMNYTHCQIYASQIIQSFKFKIAFLFFVGFGLKGCVVF